MDYFAYFAVLATAALVSVQADPISKRQGTKPVFSSASPLYQINSYPSLNRDSLVSCRVGTRELWLSRDATNFDGQGFFLWPSTASWTNFNADGTPAIVSNNLTTYGTNTGAYLPLPANECGPYGGCNNGNERWVGWPDTNPIPVNQANGAVKIYVFAKNVHTNAQGNAVNQPGGPTSLYRLDFDGSVNNNLPSVTLVNINFWPSNTPTFGDYGGFVGYDKFAYLYGRNAEGTVLARVDPAKIETGPYSYYSQSTGWSTTLPSYTQTRAAMPNAGNGQQGTFYFSTQFNRCIWIGGEAGDDSRFLYTTAPTPWGPWDALQVLYTPTPGTSFNGYSQQAHPGLSTNQGNGKDIWLSYTRINHYYENVLFKVSWQ